MPQVGLVSVAHGKNTLGAVNYRSALGDSAVVLVDA